MLGRQQRDGRPKRGDFAICGASLNPLLSAEPEVVATDGGTRNL